MVATNRDKATVYLSRANAAWLQTQRGESMSDKINAAIDKCRTMQTDSELGQFAKWLKDRERKAHYVLPFRGKDNVKMEGATTLADLMQLFLSENTKL